MPHQSAESDSGDSNDVSSQYLNYRPDPLAEARFEDVDASDAFDQIDRLLDAEIHIHDIDRSGEFSVAVCFPDIYENGIANIGHQMLYLYLNRTDSWWADRAYAPSDRLRKALAKLDQPYFTWETKTQLGDHDVIAFSLPFEELAENLIAILDHSDLPLYAEDRDESDPIVVCGGATPNYNPEPYAPFVDCFYLGEIPTSLNTLFPTLASGLRSEVSRRQLLKDIAKQRSVYVPQFYDVEYDSETGAVTEMVATEPEAAGQIEKTVDEEYTERPAHSVIVTPHSIHEGVTFSIEATRGCAYSCNFCQYGNNNHPARWLSPDELESALRDLLVEPVETVNVHFEATEGDHLTEVFSVFERIQSEYDVTVEHGAFTANQVTDRMIDISATGGKDDIIVAPEAASGEMRATVGKHGFYADEDIFRLAETASNHNVPIFGLYLLMGLPGEQRRHIDDLADLIADTRDHLEIDGYGYLSVHINPMFPKPLTPFQWAPMERPEQSVEKLDYLVARLQEQGYEVVVDATSKAVIEAGFDISEPLLESDGEPDIVVKTINGSKMQYSQPILARGDRRIGEVLLEAYKRGNDREAWETAMEVVGIDDDLFFREREIDETLPWEFIRNSIQSAHREDIWNGVQNLVDSHGHGYSM